MNSFNTIENYRMKYEEDYHSHVREDLVKYVSGGPKVILDIGCGKGLTAKFVKDKFGADRAIGIELDKDAGEEAGKVLDEIYILDLNQEAFPDAVNNIDLIILGDILEHLIDPYSLLRILRERLTKNGQIILSIPNIRNWRVLCAIIFKADWRYRDSGIMDKTHLRFFTKKSVIRMINDAGLKLEKYGYRLRLPERILNIFTLTLFRNFFTSQMYFSIKKK